MDVDELRSYLNQRSDKVLPVSVFMEMITHFRDEPNHIREILSFAGSKSPIICNNVRGYPITLDDIRELYQRHDDAFYKQYASEVLGKKIDVEAFHACIFLKIVSTAFIDDYSKTCTSLTREVVDNLVQNYFNAREDYLLQELSAALRNGYAENKEEQYLKSGYLKLLTECITVLKGILDMADHWVKGEQDLYSAMCESITEAKDNDYAEDNMMETIKKALGRGSDFLREAKMNIPDIFSKYGYSALQGDYIVVMLNKWINKKQLLRKNDIFDLLFLGAANTNVDTLVDTELNRSPLLLTFDGELMNFIHDRDEASKDLISRFKEFENEKSFC